MKRTFPFRTTAIIVSAAMCFVFLYQVYWLAGLYRTMNDQLQKNIHEAMEIADQNELFLRLEQIKETPGLHGSIESSVEYDKAVGELKANTITSGSGSDSTGQSSVVVHRDSSQVNVSFQGAMEQVEFRSFKENARTTVMFAVYLQKGMHQAADRILPVSLAVYDSLLTEVLDSMDIREQHAVQLVHLTDDSVCASIPEVNFPTSENYISYEYPFDANNQYAYRLYLKNSNKQVIQQMSGILATSIVIFFLLIYIFIYLLKTIRRMQTEEELKTDFTNNMTHELKTPLAVSYAAVDALLVSERPGPTEKQRKYLTIAKEQMMHLTGLVERILAMSRKDNRQLELNRETVLVKELVDSLTDQFHVVSGKNVHFTVDVQPPELTAHADKTHLYHVFNNLIENGIKYSDEPGSIAIQARKEGSHIIITVADQGIGIDSHHQKRVFDKFYRIPAGNRHNVKGYGLGLFYVKEMIEKHGGTIHLKSHPRKGSVFTINLPQ